MNKRLRYIKDVNGNCITSNYVKNDGGAEFRAGFIADGKAGFIKSVGDDTTDIKLTATSAHKIKIKIKRALVRLGCVFEKETRKPRITDEAQ